MKILSISRPFSQTFRCIKKSTNFQNHFYEINAIFPKSKQNMSDSKKQTNSTSNAKPDNKDKEDRGERGATASNNSYHRPKGQSSRMMTTNHSKDANISSYNFYSTFQNTSYRQPVVAFNSHPSHYEPLYYQMNGTMFYHTFRPIYYQPSSQASYGYPNHSSPKRMYSHSSNSVSKEETIERLTKFRQMIKLRSFNELDHNEFRFSIMTYNILSQNLMEDHSSLYEHCETSALSWPKRGQRILKELLDSDCDIMCLQEVHCEHFDQHFMPALKQKGYNSVFKQRTGGKMDGCAIVYKESKFLLLNTIKLDFMRKDLSSLLDRDNIAIIVELKPKEWERQSKLIVANTHLLYNPKRGDVKLAQIRLLMAEIDKIAKISEKEGPIDHNPIILCGDLNSEHNSLLYNFITKGLANFNGLKVGDISGQKQGFGRGRDVEDHHLKLLGVTSDTRFEKPFDNQTKDKKKLENDMSIKHNFKLKSVVLRSENKFGDKLISTSNRFDSGLVDYIFYDYEKLKLNAFQRLLTDKQLPQIGYIPNSVLGSDHLSLKAIFSMI